MRITACLLSICAAAHAGPPSAGFNYEDVSASSGMLPYFSEPGHGAGIAAADYDGDGDIDLFVPQGSGMPDRLYRNNGSGSFEDVAPGAGLGDLPDSRTALWLDYDGDHDLDLLIANDTPTAESCLRLYRQDDSLNFTDVTASSGILSPPLLPNANIYHWGGICAGDINNDGWPDIFTGQWYGPGRLYLNGGDGTFTDISASSGVNVNYHMHQPVMLDINEDGWMDIYAAIDFDPNLLWINQGDNTFIESAAEYGLDNDMNDMGVVVGDYDNDQDLDIYVTNVYLTPEEFNGPRYNVLYRNDSTPEAAWFTEVAEAMGVADGGWGWGTTFTDADLDGDWDIAATNGWRDGNFEFDLSRLFNNPGDGVSPFTEHAAEVNFADDSWGSALIAVDIDRNGTPDMVQLAYEEAVRILRNVPDIAAPARHHVLIRPRMNGPNTHALGAVVHVTTADGTLTRPIGAGTSYMGQEPAEALFGTGARSVAQRIEVTWPSGTSSTIDNAPLDSTYDVVHPRPFTEEAFDRGLVYQMQGYPQDYGYLGFGAGFADLDSDGDPDVVIIGNSAGKVGIFENIGGQFVDRSTNSGIPTLPQGSAFTAADYDADGDLDLYFTQLAEPNVLVRNEGGVQFVDVTATAGVGDPGSAKAAVFGDYDGDGWVDLYVCNYNGIVAGTEDLDNRLYRNKGNGLFEDVSSAQGVDDSGFGFQAVWFDYDRDGDLDLYLSNDRGHDGQPNRLWENVNGQLVDISTFSGADVALFSMGVACGDFDGNGYPDLYCTNVGDYTLPKGCPAGMNCTVGYNPLLLNNGDGTFGESAAQAGVAAYLTGWGATFLDYDNDSRVDLHLNNMFVNNNLYDCSGGFPCVESGAPAAVSASTGGPQGPVASFSSATADVDGDGDLDLLVNNLGGIASLFINHEGQDRNWLRYRVVGESPNRFAIGANIDTRLGTAWHYREILAGGNGYLGQNELVAHLGLGVRGKADEILITWPQLDGANTTRTLTDLPANNTWTLYPPHRLGDADGDGAVDLSDFDVFDGCFGEPFGPGCEVMDFDGNSAVELSDFAAFLERYDATLVDCDDNGTVDLEEILLDVVQDINENGVPDPCESCADVSDCADLNGDNISDDACMWFGCDGVCAQTPRVFADMGGGQRRLRPGRHRRRQRPLPCVELLLGPGHHGRPGNVLSV